MGIFDDPARLKSHIAKSLESRNTTENFFRENSAKNFTPITTSSVLFLLSNYSRSGFSPEPFIVLNKRSKKVVQPGDICFPGGGVAPRLDGFLSKVMPLPGLPLCRWTYWKKWREKRPEEANGISLVLATCLRESYEEMRLNPFGMEFLGPMPPHCLRMFRKKVYPMLAWDDWPRRFRPNWEVDKIVEIPLRSLFHEKQYAKFRISFAPELTRKLERGPEDFPCFIIDNGHEKEILWGVTYRIVTAFLKLVFHFEPPPFETLPMISRTLKNDYMGNGA